MPLEPETPVVEFVGNGVTNAFDQFPGFTLSDPSHLVVLIDGEIQVSGFTQNATGIVFSVAPADGAAVVLRRETPVEQPVTVDGLRVFALSLITGGFDRLVRILQEIAHRFTRTLRVPEGETVDELPAANSRKAKVVYFHATTGGLQLLTPEELFALTSGGVAFTVGEVTTGDAGSDVIVTITGTAPDLVLNFSIPQGDQGEQGPGAHFIEGVPSAGLGENGQYAVDTLTGIFYKKTAGTWSAITVSTGGACYLVTATPAIGFGNNDDVALLHSGGYATQLLQKLAGTWTVVAAFATGISLADVKADRQRNQHRRFQCLPHSLLASGAGSQAIATNGLGCQLNAGSAAGGYARAVLSNVVTGFPGLSGAGINFGRRLRVELDLTCITTAAANGGRVRLVVGEVGTGAPRTADVDALATMGFGVEFGDDGGVPSARVFVHNGSAYNVSEWYPNATEFRSMTSLALESDGAGTVSLYLTMTGQNTGPQELPAVATLTRTLGPTGFSNTTNIYASLLCVAHATNAPAANSIVGYLRHSAIEVN